MSILKLGSKGEQVRYLQRLINQSRLYPNITLNPDGVFGGDTDKAVRAVQKVLGLVEDGKAGGQTLKALKAAVTPAKPNARPEPDKSPVNVPVQQAQPGTGEQVTYKAPPNVDSLKLLDTARPISEIIFHCTATIEGKTYTVDDVRAWHKARGFTDVGYHYLIYPDGRVMLGRPIGQVGSHVAGHNTGSIGISYFGGIAKDGKTAKDTRTPEQRASALWLVDTLAKKFKVKKITGHNLYANKACPCFDVAKDQLSKLAA